MTIEEKQYKITKDQCKANIHGICSGCGGEITPIETVDNSGDPTFWPGCEKCSVFDYGTDPHIFNIAKRMVEEGYSHYGGDIISSPYGKSEEYKKYWLSSQIRGTTGLVRQILKIHTEMKNKDK